MHSLELDRLHCVEPSGCFSTSMDKSRRHDRQASMGVGGRLRQRLAQMLLHTSCAATTTSATAFVGLARTTNAAAEPPQHPLPPTRARPRGTHDHEPRPSGSAVGGDGSSSCQRRRRRHHRRRGARALVHISIDCPARSSVAAAAVLQPSAPVPTLRSKGKGGGSGSRLPRSPTYGYGWSWSSSSSDTTDTDTDGEAAPFSSEGEAEEEGAGTARSSTLFSSRSRSFSSGSASDLYTTTNNNGGGGGGGTRPRRRKRNPPQPPRRAPSSRPPAAAADVFRSPAGEHRGKKEEWKSGDGSRCGCGSAVAASGSTAVVKRSRNPYADFRSSMVEMVAGRRIRGADALSELLVSYLSLNSPRHHPAILAAFEDVWEAVLGSEP